MPTPTSGSVEMADAQDFPSHEYARTQSSLAAPPMETYQSSAYRQYQGRALHE